LPVANPVDLVLEQGVVVGLANHTILVSKNGDEYQIADSASPIRNRNGEMRGVVLVFRDVTNEYKTQQKIIDGEIDSTGSHMECLLDCHHSQKPRSDKRIPTC
jgi:hypothetical protein